jgi:hypothetical protein
LGKALNRLYFWRSYVNGTKTSGTSSEVSRLYENQEYGRCTDPSGLHASLEQRTTVTPEDTYKLTALLSIIVLLLVLFAISTVRIWITDSRKKRAVATPVTEAGLRQFDNLPPGMAVAHAWTDAGNQPHYHRMMQDNVRAEMPLLARALDRLVED